MNLIEREILLYEKVKRWIDADFKSSDAFLGHPQNSTLFSDDVSTTPDSSGGLWSRPDLAAVVYSKAEFIPSWVASLYSFEVKTFKGANEAGVFETLAHTRYVNYSYLVWQAPNKLPWNMEKLVRLCAEYGVGAVTTETPDDPTSYVVRLQAQHNTIPTRLSDLFIRERFSNEKKRAISSWLSHHGWALPNQTSSVS